MVTQDVVILHIDQEHVGFFVVLRLVEALNQCWSLPYATNNLKSKKLQLIFRYFNSVRHILQWIHNFVPKPNIHDINLIRQIPASLFRGYIGPTGTSWNPLMFNTKSCNWGRLALGTRTDWVLTSWKATLQGSIWESWQTTGHEPGTCPHGKDSQKPS